MSEFKKWRAFVMRRMRQRWMEFRLSKPSRLDQMIRFRHREKATQHFETRFDIPAPLTLRRAMGDPYFMKWDFMGAAKFLLQCRPETIVAIFGHYFKGPLAFKPPIITSMWLTIPRPAFTGEIRAMQEDVMGRMPPPARGDAERLVQRIRDEADEQAKAGLRGDLDQRIFDAQVGEILFFMAEANGELAAHVLVNMPTAASVNFLERTTAPGVMPVLRFKLQDHKGGDAMTKTKLLYALRNKNPDQAKAWLGKFPIEEAATIRSKFMDLDDKSINEFKLKHEEMKTKSEAVSVEHGKLKYAADQIRFKNEPLKQQTEEMSLQNKLQSGGNGRPPELQQNLQRNVAELAFTVNKLLSRYIQEDSEPRPAPPPDTDSGNGNGAPPESSS